MAAPTGIVHLNGAVVNSTASGTSSSPKQRGKKKKTQFEARLKDDVSVDGIGAKLKLSSNIAKNPLLEDAGAVMTAADTTKQTNSGKPRLHKKSRSFRAHKTAEGKVYYSDTDTNETRWNLPEDGVVL